MAQYHLCIFDRLTGAAVHAALVKPGQDLNRNFMAIHFSGEASNSKVYAMRVATCDSIDFDAAS
jgi:hypothetical protein